MLLHASVLYGHFISLLRKILYGSTRTHKINKFQHNNFRKYALKIVHGISDYERYSVIEGVKRTLEVIIFTGAIKVRPLAIHSYKSFCWRNTVLRNDGRTIIPTREENTTSKRPARVSPVPVLLLFLTFFKLHSFLSISFLQFSLIRRATRYDLCNIRDTDYHLIKIRETSFLFF